VDKQLQAWLRFCQPRTRSVCQLVATLARLAFAASQRRTRFGDMASGSACAGSGMLLRASQAGSLHCANRLVGGAEMSSAYREAHDPPDQLGGSRTTGVVPDPRGLAEVTDQLEPIRTPGGIASAGRSGCNIEVWLGRAISSTRVGGNGGNHSPTVKCLPGGVPWRSRRTVRLREGARS
jgi:hypothetical protein